MYTSHRQIQSLPFLLHASIRPLYPLTQASTMFCAAQSAANADVAKAARPAKRMEERIVTGWEGVGFIKNVYGMQLKAKWK